MKNLIAAKEVTNPVLGSLGNQSGTGFFSAFVPRLVTMILIAGGLIFFFVFVSGAIQWITSGGDKQKLEAARGRITSGIVGIVLLFVAFAVMTFIEKFFGIQILTIDITPLIIQQ